MRSDLVSIVIPCYNLQDQIGKCLQSLTSQTYPHLEIIVIDDGSADNSFSVLQAAAAADPRIRAVRQENAGPSAARNHGIDLATGSYLMFIDGDDYVANTFVEHFMDAAEDCDLVISGMTYVFPDAPSYSVQEAAYRCNLQDYVHNHYTDSIVNRSVFGPCCKLYRLSLLHQCGIRFDESISIHEDGIFVFSFLTHCQQIAGIPYVEYFYVQHAVSGSLVSKFHADELQINSRHFDLMLSVYGDRQIPDAELVRIYPMFLNTEIATIRKFYCSREYSFRKGIQYIRSVLQNSDFLKIRKALHHIDRKKARKFYRPLPVVHIINYLASRKSRR